MRLAFALLLALLLAASAEAQTVSVTIDDQIWACEAPVGEPTEADWVWNTSEATTTLWGPDGELWATQSLAAHTRNWGYEFPQLLISGDNEQRGHYTGGIGIEVRATYAIEGKDFVTTFEFTATRDAPLCGAFPFECPNHPDGTKYLRFGPTLYITYWDAKVAKGEVWPETVPGSTRYGDLTRSRWAEADLVPTPAVPIWTWYDHERIHKNADYRLLLFSDDYKSGDKARVELRWEHAEAVSWHW